jgi:hypothetical protein
MERLPSGPPGREHYTPENVELGLQMLALSGGRPRAACKMLKQQGGPDIHRDTLMAWRERYHARYVEICEERQAEVHRAMAAKATEIAEKAAGATELLVDATVESIGDLEGKDLAISARNLSQVHAAAVEKTLLLRGQATQIHKIESLDEVVDALSALGVINGEEPVDAEVVDEEEMAELEEAK